MIICVYIFSIMVVFFFLVSQLNNWEGPKNVIVKLSNLRQLDCRTHKHKRLCIYTDSFCFLFLEPQPTGSLASSLFSTAMRMGSWAAFQKRRTRARVPTTRWSARPSCPARWATRPPASPAPLTTAPAAAPATRATCSARGSASPRLPSPPIITSASRPTCKISR